MNRRAGYLPAVLVPLLLLSLVVGGGSMVALGASVGRLAGGPVSGPTGVEGQTSNAIPAPICPTPPVNTTFGPVNCFQALDLTEVFVILIGLTITFYVYKDADKAELPGEATEVAVTAEEELANRLRKETEERERRQMEGGHP